MNLLNKEKGFEKLFIRDIDKNYHLRGLGSATKDIHETIEAIKGYTTRKNYGCNTAAGASAAGFAAILFANILGIKKAVAFNPQTVVSEEKDTLVKDTLYAVKRCRQLRDLDKQVAFYQKCLNLKNFIPFTSPFTTFVDLHFASDSTDLIDRRHAELIAHNKCRLIEHKSSTKLLALESKDQGVLQQYHH